MTRSSAGRRSLASDRPGDSSRPALVLWISLVTLAALRAILAILPSMWGWGFNLIRFLPPALGWALWLIPALALIPALSRLLTPGARAIGDFLGQGGAGAWRAPALLAAIAGVAVWLQPDRLRFAGDFLLRHGTTERALNPGALYPQALPLEVLLHYELPRRLAGWGGLPVEALERALGSLEAGAIAALAVGFARALELRGTAALAVTAIALGGGYLGLCTGYGKSVAEMALLSLGLATAGILATRDPRALWPLGLCLAAGLALHRSALGLLPAALVSWWLALRAGGASARRPLALAALAPPLLALAVMLPRIVATMLRWDPVHFTPSEVTSHGGMLRAALAGTRPADIVNVVGVVSPLALAIPLLAWALGRAALRDRAIGIAAALALPWVILIPFIHPPQGMFRDWDDFGPAGMTLSVLGATLVARSLRDRPRWEWLGLAAALAALGPTEQWLAHHADRDRGLERIEAYLAEPPRRGEAERGTTWDFLGVRYGQLGRWDSAAAALAHAAETAPSPRILTEWGLAERSRGNESAARDLFARVATIAPGDPNSWFRLATASWHLGDYDECRRAMIELARLAPGDSSVARMMRDLDRVNPAHEPAK